MRYRTDVMLDNAHLCHCRMCQKAVGNLFAALVATPNDRLVWTRGTPAVFRSSDLAERGFCAACGTPLFYNSLDNDRINLTIGSLDDPAAFPPRGQTGTESRMPWFAGLAALEDGGATGAAGNAAWAEAIRRSNHQHPDHETDDWP
ncbi:MAG: GFA family protein [Albidovulum sp.]